MDLHEDRILEHLSVSRMVNGALDQERTFNRGGRDDAERDEFQYVVTQRTRR